jgi:hypothetical protein
MLYGGRLSDEAIMQPFSEDFAERPITDISFPNVEDFMMVEDLRNLIFVIMLNIVLSCIPPDYKITSVELWPSLPYSFCFLNLPM